MTTLLALLVEVDGDGAAEHARQTIDALNKQRAQRPSRQVSYDFRAGALRFASIVDVPDDAPAADREVVVVLRRDFDEILRQARADVAREVLQALCAAGEAAELVPSEQGTVEFAANVVAEQYGVTL